MAKTKAEKSEPSGEAALDDILGRLVRIVAEVRKRQHAVTKTHGVTMLQYTAIHELRKRGPLNITQLAEFLHLNQSTVSSLVDRMERDGLVRKLQSTQDRRSVKLRLTDKADDLAEAVPISPFDFFKTLLGSLDTNEVRLVAKMLGKVEGVLLTRLEEIDAKSAAR